jgi:hypothetical protein
MLRGYWLSIFAVVGWLIACVALAQSPSSQGVTSKTPTVKEQSAGQAKKNGNAANDLSIPVRIIDDPIEAQRTRDRQQKADQHEADDLAAQRKAADAAWQGVVAAERQIYPAWGQVVFAFIGTCLLIGTLIASIKATKSVQDDLRLSHPPKFKITRPLISSHSIETPPGQISELPLFVAGETIHGCAFAVNYGRFAATLMRAENALNADCYFFFAENDVIPMSEAYLRQGHQERWSPIRIDPSNNSTSKIKAGGFANWYFSGTIPADFKKKTKWEWSHSICIIGHIRYIGAAKDARGYYFCKRYDPKRQCFVSVEEHEVED